MPYQPSPNKTEKTRRLNVVRSGLARHGVDLIVGDAFRSHSGLCVRLRYLHDVGIEAPREGVQEAAAEAAEQAHDQDAGASQ